MLAGMKDVNGGRNTRGTTRRDRARATAATIVEAATVEFAANGYQGTTMAMIAARAGVAVQTVHFVFHTKGELLTAAVESAVVGAGDPPERAEWFKALIAEPDPGEQLRGFVHQGGGVLVRASAINEVARSAALTDPDAAAAFDRLERLRWDGYRSLLEVVATKTAFRAGMDIESATDVLFTLVSPRTYLSLTRDRGWAPERALAWMADIVPFAILGPPTA